jgi:uncharacterized protein (TIGR02466 family)
MTEDDQLPIPKCSIALLFPTAVASFQCGQHKAFKTTFMERLPAHCISHESGQGLISGESSGKVYLHTDAAMEAFFRFVSQCIAAYLDQLSYDRSRVAINIVKTWISATNNDTVTPVHAHATSHLSFVYYMNMPKETDAIAFQIQASPNEPYYGAFSESTNRQRSMVRERNVLNANQSIMLVEEGQLLVFPSHLHHGTVKMGDMGNEQRIALSGDVLLVFNEEEPNYATGVFDPRTWRSFGNL